MTARQYIPGRGTFIAPIKHPRVKHPIDLPEPLLAELSRLFLAESRAVERDAMTAYTRSSWEEGARLELASDGLRFDSHEIAELAMVKRRLRLNDRERNLLPWERLRERSR